MKLNHLVIKNFSQINGIDGSYGRGVKPNCKLEKYRDGYRISYRLPNNLKDWHYLSSDIISDPKAMQSYLKEFDAVLLNGYFPTKIVDRLKLDPSIKNSGRVTIMDALNMYYNEYNSGKRQKSIGTAEGEKKTLTYIMDSYFIHRLKINFLSDINTEALVKFNKDIESYKKRTTLMTLSVASIATYKKLVKAFVNCLIDYNKIDKSVCDTTKIVTTVYTKGKSDIQACSRLVVIPQEVIEAVKNCSYKTPGYLPDMKELFLLVAEAGPRKSELLTLSEHNLYPDAQSFNEISIFDKDGCPTNHQIGFTVKSRNSVRKIPLSKRSIDFIKAQLEKHKLNKRYGIIGSRKREHQLVEYPFLFPRYDSKFKKWVRLDNFRKSFNSLIETAIKEANLKDCARYTLHDLRRTVNLWLREHGFTGEQASAWLGHSEETNKISYLALKDKQELIHKKNSISAKKLFKFSDLSKDTPKNQNI